MNHIQHVNAFQTMYINWKYDLKIYKIEILPAASKPSMRILTCRSLPASEDSAPTSFDSHKPIARSKNQQLAWGCNPLIKSRQSVYSPCWCHIYIPIRTHGSWSYSRGSCQRGSVQPTYLDCTTRNLQNAYRYNRELHNVHSRAWYLLPHIAESLIKRQCPTIIMTHNGNTQSNEIQRMQTCIIRTKIIWFMCQVHRKTNIF